MESKIGTKRRTSMTGMGGLVMVMEFGGRGLLRNIDPITEEYETVQKLERT